MLYYTEIITRRHAESVSHFRLDNKINKYSK